MLVEAQRLSILLIDIDFGHPHIFNGIPQQGFPNSLAVIIGADEQHLTIALGHAKEGYDGLLGVADAPQVYRIQILVEDERFEILNILF